MPELYFPFNSVLGDREYTAPDFSRYFADIISSGISANGDNLPVVAAGGLRLSVGPGMAWILGHLYYNTTTKNLTIKPGSALPRIDRVVARLMVVERKIESMVIEGTPATSPKPPALLRNDDYYDIGLAEVSVPASTIQITNLNIEDTRWDSDVCGVIRTLIETLDVGAFMKNCREAFEAWLANLQYVLDGDVAGHLQNEIERHIVNKHPHPEIDCGSFEDDDDLLAHMLNPVAHKNMSIDGNISGVSTATTLKEHAEDPYAHPNLIIDGND